MKCIFCKNDSSTSKSVEHIVPESLGNKDIILPKGIVCDLCNNYFASKVEKALLEDPYFVSVRFRNEIRTKKNKLVKQTMLFPGALKSTDVVLQHLEDGIICSFNDEQLYQAIIEGKCANMIAPYLPEPEFPNASVSRFLAKCAVEYLVYIIDNEKRACFIADDSLWIQLDPIIKFARYNIGNWNYSQRQIYMEKSTWIDTKHRSSTPYQVLHEMCFFFGDYTKYENGEFYAEMYFALVIMGIEYVICISDPDICRYRDWLKDNNSKSPLERDFEYPLN